MATYEQFLAQKKNKKESSLDKSEKDSDISNIQSIFAGIGSGLIEIPKGVFSLGATLMDLGADTNKAAEVEKWFDDLTTWDEKAEATTAGKITQVLVNLGVPGAFAFTKGASLANKALKSKSLRKYFLAGDKALQKNLGKAALKAAELNKKGKTARFIAAATAGGAADGVFVGDVEEIGTFGDLFGGPTEIERDEEYDPERELINRVKFGTEGALFVGVLGGAGKTIKQLATRGRELRYSNRHMDQLLEKVASKFRAAGETPELFPLKRKEIGARARDINQAQEVFRGMEKHIDAIFPSFKFFGRTVDKSTRKKGLQFLNEALISGVPTVDKAGKVTIGAIAKKEKDAAIEFLKKAGIGGGKEKMDHIKNIFANMSIIRGAWGDMFTSIGTKLEGKDLAKFKNILGEKFKNYIWQTYDIFTNQSMVPGLRYRPQREQIDEVIEIFLKEDKANIARMKTAVDRGAKLTIPKPMTREGAEGWVARIIKDVKPVKGSDITKKIFDPVFEIPNYFPKGTILNDATKVSKRNYTSLANFTSDARQAFERLFGKRADPMLTTLASTTKLSMVTRRNEFFSDILKESDKLKTIADDEFKRTGTRKTKGIFYDDPQEAAQKLGVSIQDIEQISKKGIDPQGKFDAGIIHPLNEKYALREIVEAVDATAVNVGSTTTIGKLYDNLILYPKATSQLAKTVLSPVTHMRNLLSAGAFATANGIIPTPANMKLAYEALQVPMPGARKSFYNTAEELAEATAKGELKGNDLYRRLLDLGVVNKQVQLGDITRLMKDVDFGGTVNQSLESGRFLANTLKRMKKFKDVSKDFYTAEDDFWKIISWATEKSRLQNAYGKHGIRKTIQELEEEAADIVKNNIPNYDYVSEFVKGLRQLPIGNFVSFPAEILRTSTNIVQRGLKEITTKHTLKDGSVVRPLAGIGYQRLLGMGVTTVGVPAAAVTAGQMVYDVSKDELDAIRRYVADWSKNSTLVPLRDDEGNLKYIDFSHANAYDTLTRPFQTVINSVAAGREDADGMMDDFALGMFNATKELGQPFVSESIWTEALSDIWMRLGRTREGYRVWRDKDTAGDKVMKGLDHLVKAQMPFSWEQLKRLDVAIKPVDIIQDRPGPYDEYGQAYELGDELAGFVGMRAINVNPERGLNFKIAEYQRNVRNSRQLFSAEALKGGIISPEEIIDLYINANRALFESRRKMMLDLDAAEILGLSEDKVGSVATEGRMTKSDLGTLKEGIFRPLPISRNIAAAFARNAEKLGVANPLETALPIINRIREILFEAPLSLEMFPKMPNPFRGKQQMAEGGRVGFVNGGEVEETDDKTEAATIWITEPDVIRQIYNYDFEEYFLSGAWKSKSRPPIPASAGTAGAQAKAPTDIGTPTIDPNLLGKGPNTINNVGVTSTGLTQTENALLSNEEKAIRLRQRGIG